MEEYNEKKQLVNDLWDGKKTIADIDLVKFYKIIDDYDILRAAAHGCSVTNDGDTLLVLYYLMLGKVKKPNAEKIKGRKELEKTIIASGAYPDVTRMTHNELVEYWNSRIRGGAYSVLKEVITSAESVRFTSPVCSEIITSSTVSEDFNLRHFVACVTNNPGAFIDDPNENVRKVAFIRASLDMKLKTASEQEIQQITFIRSALKAKFIKCFDGLTGTVSDDTISARFESPLFAESPYVEFDKDVFYNIPDLTVTADEINKLIKDGTIKFAGEMKPPFFGEPVYKKKSK